MYPQGPNGSLTFNIQDSVMIFKWYVPFDLDSIYFKFFGIIIIFFLMHSDRVIPKVGKMREYLFFYHLVVPHFCKCLGC